MATHSVARPSTSTSATQSVGTGVVRRPVIVGVDASAASVAAVTWAASEAQALGVPLQVIGAYHWGLLDPWTSAPDPLITSKMRLDCLKVVDKTVADVHEKYPELVVSGEAIDADPRDVLADRGAASSMVVVGTRHTSGLGRAVLGSVSTGLTGRASCPVVVLCGPPGDLAERPSVVAGVTGENGTDEVLAFAFAQAQLYGLPLHAIMCWRPDLTAERLWGGAEPPAPDKAERWLTEALAGWRDRYPEVHVQDVVVRDHAVSGLVSASLSQHLLVVGRHGRRPWRNSVLGSVSQGVLHHATCPVAVVPVRPAS